MSDIKVQDVIQRLEVRKKKSIRYADLSIVFLIASTISLYVFYADTKKALFSFCIGITATIVSGNRSSKYHKQYRKIYKNIFVKRIIEEKFDEVHYEWERGFTGPQIYDFQLLTYKGHISDDYLKAVYNGVTFEQADVKHSDQAGKHPRFNFCGKMMRFTSFPVNLSGVWIYTKNFEYCARYSDKSMKWIGLEDSEFTSVFDVYAYNESDAERILKPQLRENLLILAKKSKSLGMSFRGNKLHLGINTDRDTFDVDVSKKNIDYDSEVAKVRMDVEDTIEVMELLGIVSKKVESSKGT